MALLTHLRTGRTVTLAERALVGRHPSCLIDIRDPMASSEHATLRWRTDQWWVRDLGSTNGTFVDGARLDAGSEVELTTGVRIAFGNPGDLWMLEQGGPPGVFARSMDREAVVFAATSLLLLPDSDEPAWGMLHRKGVWVVDGAGTPVRDQQIVTVGEERWQICIPQGIPPTQRAPERMVELRFLVSQDEEFVELEVVDGERTVRLKSRASHYLLLTLARLRIDDTTSAPEARGWVNRDLLASQLSMKSGSLAVQLFRLRRELGAVRPDLGVRVIEGRARTGQIRFGLEVAGVIRL